MEESKMYPATRFIVKGIPFQAIVSAFLVTALTLFPHLASADEDPCRETGIYIGNQTTLNVWYTRNGGPCTIWSHGHLLVVKPKDTLIIYRDMTCKIEYCPKSQTYDDYRSLDTDQNCRVRILPDCTLSDM
jgi:hypothetical protein